MPAASSSTRSTRSSPEMDPIAVAKALELQPTVGTMETRERRSTRMARPKPSEVSIPSNPAERWARAVRHLRRVDPHLKAIIDRVGPCLLEPKTDRFGILVRAIIGQQISSKAAAVDRQSARGDRRRAPPSRRLIELGEATLRGVGLSGVKARYVLNLAEAVASGAGAARPFDDSWDDAGSRKVSPRSRGSASGPPRCS